MAQAFSRREPELPRLGPDLTKIDGGRRIADRHSRRELAAARQRSLLQLGVLSACAAAVSVGAALLVFTTLRGSCQNQAKPVVAPLIR
jgi:hypothetical protein